MSMIRQQTLFSKNVAKLIQHILTNDYYLSLGEAYRTPEQAEIYAKQGKGIKNSLHIKRLAIDINLFDKSGKYLIESKYYEPFGKFWESLDPNNRWGGNFIMHGGHIDDPNHYEQVPEKQRTGDDYE
jgi:hypothetical protein